MGQHKLVRSIKTVGPEHTREQTIRWPKSLWERMEKAQTKFKVKPTDGGPEFTPDMEQCVKFWMENFIALFEQASEQHEAAQRYVLTPDEMKKMGVKLPPVMPGLITR